jgi:hypothetical protein
MTSLFAALLAPLALLLPGVAGPQAAPMADPVRHGPQSRPPLTGGPASSSPLQIFQDTRPDEPSWQVRIEQRVIIRIAPGNPEAREQFMSALPRRQIRESFQEERMRGCVPISTIVGVQPGPDNRLLLFMSDRRVLTVELARTCNARDFYAGFYIERNDDGRLCGGRDELQSRAGASCAVEGLNRLMAVRN